MNVMINKAELAELLNVTLNQITLWVKDGQLPKPRISNKTRSVELWSREQLKDVIGEVEHVSV